MSLKQTNPSSSSTRRDPVPRLLSAAALGVSIMALLFSMGGFAPALKSAAPTPAPTAEGTPTEPTPPTEPTEPTAPETPEEASPPKKKPGKKTKGSAEKKKIAALEGKLGKLKLSCPISSAIDLGSWCLEGSTFKVPATETGQNNYVYATQKCVAEGGWLPTAAQLIGAAPKIALKSTIDDDPGTSGASEFPEAKAGIKDEREMTSDLFTTTAGSRAAGTEGVTQGSKGVGNLGEPDPVPVPSEPLPETLDYVTVYDNHNLGGFAGGEPVGKAESFRCAYAKGYQGKPKDTSSRS